MDAHASRDLYLTIAKRECERREGRRASSMVRYTFPDFSSARSGGGLQNPFERAECIAVGWETDQSEASARGRVDRSGKH